MRLRRFPRLSARSVALTAALAAASGCGLGGGCTNAPFDPDSIPNERPVARIYVTSASGDTLNATSYYNRTFSWSGSDADGRVVEFYVSLETQRGVSAPWDTTTRTDTTMTFTTNDLGHAEVTLRVACRDDRGALSDTVSQYIPLRNFPPVVNFQSDFDTLRWSYGAANFRLFALDLDGNETLEDSLLYRLDTADTTIVRAIGSPGADPALCWVRKAYDDPVGRTFNIALKGTPPATRRTLTVSVRDAARSDARLNWTWKVLEARGPVLLVADAGPGTYNTFYRPVMDNLFGAQQWSLYNLGSSLVEQSLAGVSPELYYIGLPDKPWVMLETMRQFPVVLWYTGGGASLNLKGAVEPITRYLAPAIDPATGLPEAPAGRLMLVSKALVGTYTNLPPGFVTGVLGVSTVAAPPADFFVPVGKRALGQRVTLPAFTSVLATNRQALGLQLRTGTEALYKLEYYQYSPDGRPPYEPIVVTRKPTAVQSPLATALVMSLQLEFFDQTQVTAALRALLRNELGVTLP
ncbi:MAG: hypothetical protein ACYDIE_00640 [Candidatus Krumholzibacteriia bacterium]